APVPWMVRSGHAGASAAGYVARSPPQAACHNRNDVIASSLCLIPKPWKPASFAEVPPTCGAGTGKDRRRATQWATAVLRHIALQTLFEKRGVSINFPRRGDRPS